MPRILPFTGSTGYARDFAAVALAVGAYAAITTLGHVELGVDQTAAAELFFLAQLAAAVLVTVAYLSPTAAAWTGLGVVLVAWSIGMGTVRGTATVIVLTVGIALAARDHALARENALTLRYVATSIALQLLMRTDVVVAADPGMVTWVLVALPVIAGLCLRVMAQCEGRLGAALAGGCVVLLGPGWTLEGVCTLVALTAALAWTSRAAKDGRHAGLVAIGLTLPMVALVVRGPRVAGLAAAGALVLLARGGGVERPRLAPGFGNRTGFLVAALLIAAITMIVTWRGPGVAIDGLQRAVLMVGLLLPTWATAALTRFRVSWPLLGFGAMLTIVGAGDDRIALSTGAILIALALPRTGVTARLQAGWMTGLVAWVVVLRAYPWLRPSPVDTVLDTLASVTPGALGAAAMTVVAFLALASLLCALIERMGGRRMVGLTAVAPVALWGVVATTLLGPVEPPGVVLVDHPTLLSTHRGGWSRRLDPTVPTTGVVMDTNVIQSLGLPAGTILGNVQLLDGNQQSLAIWRLEIGRDTAEWAALRPDIAASPGFLAPHPWSVAAEPRARHFAARFRNDWRLEAPVTAAWITVRRSPSLPDDLQLAMYRLKVRQ